MDSKKKKNITREDSKADQILEKLDEVIVNVAEHTDILAGHTAMLDHHSGVLAETRLMIRDQNAEFKSMKGMMVQMTRAFAEFKESVTRKIDGFVGNVETLNDEQAMVGHTLDRHETMLKAVNKKVGLAHLN